jgi:hypothetical protein
MNTQHNHNIPLSHIKAILTPQINKAKAKTYIDIYLKQNNTSINNNNKELTPNKANTTQYNVVKCKSKHNINLKRRYSDNYYTTPILSYDFLSTNPKHVNNNYMCYEEEISTNNINNSINISNEFNPPHTQRISLYDKFLAQKIIKENNIEHQKAQQLQNELNLLKQPLINQYSLYLCSLNKDIQQPIYKRVNDILQQKQTNLNKLKMNKDIDIANKCKQFNSGIYNKHNFKMWIEENEEWNAKKQEKLQLKINSYQHKLHCENMKYTYKPVINKNCEEIINRKLNRSLEFKMKYDDNVGERLYKDAVERKEKLKVLQKKSVPTFKPSLIGGGKGSSYCNKKAKSFMYEIEDI